MTRSISDKQIDSKCCNSRLTFLVEKQYLHATIGLFTFEFLHNCLDGTIKLWEFLAEQPKSSFLFILCHNPYEERACLQRIPSTNLQRYIFVKAMIAGIVLL